MLLGKWGQWQLNNMSNRLIVPGSDLGIYSWIVLIPLIPPPHYSGRLAKSQSRSSWHYNHGLKPYEHLNSSTALAISSRVLLPNTALLYQFQSSSPGFTGNSCGANTDTQASGDDAIAPQLDGWRSKFTFTSMQAAFGESCWKAAPERPA